MTGFPSGLHDAAFTFLPGDLLTSGFRRVGYRRLEDGLEVVFQFYAPQEEEVNTCLAIDASESMRRVWGKVLVGDVPVEEQERYYRQNLVLEEEREGRQVRLYQPEACQDAIAKGYLNWSRNEVESTARDLLGFLASAVDTRGSCNLLYFGCDKGAGWMDLGEIPREEADRLCIPGVETFAFGKESRMLPLVQYLVSRAAAVPRTMVVLLTDGRISDMVDLQSYSSSLAILVKAGKLNFMKFVVIAMGDEVDARTLDELAGMNIAAGVDLWEIRAARDLLDFSAICGGITLRERIIGPKALVFDQDGNAVKEFGDGLPDKGRFLLPPSATGFIIQVANTTAAYRQSLLLPFRKTVE